MQLQHHALLEREAFIPARMSLVDYFLSSSDGRDRRPSRLLPPDLRAGGPRKMRAETRTQSPFLMSDDPYEDDSVWAGSRLSGRQAISPAKTPQLLFRHSPVPNELHEPLALVLRKRFGG